MSRRRQPPLFEFLGAPDRRAGAAAEGNAMGRRPVEVLPTPRPVEVRPVDTGTNKQHNSATSTPQTPAARSDTRPGSSRAGKALRLPVPAIAVAVASVVILVSVLWSLAYWRGATDKEKQLTPHLGEQVPQSNPSQPLASTTPPDTGSVPPAGTTATTTTGSAGEDPRQLGVNYLELCVLTYKDGETAVQYLAKSGVRAAMVSARKGVDPGAARTNNQPHLLFLADGVPSERFKASERERKALEAKVEQLGKRWQREEKGASDFSRPVWRLYKGRD